MLCLDVFSNFIFKSMISWLRNELRIDRLFQTFKGTKAECCWNTVILVYPCPKKKYISKQCLTGFILVSASISDFFNNLQVCVHACVTCVDAGIHTTQHRKLESKNLIELHHNFVTSQILIARW